MRIICRKAILIVLIVSSACKEKPSEPIYDSIFDPLNPNYSNTIGRDMVLISGGTFDMGDTFNEGESDEKPLHKVSLNSFYISKHEVTNSEYAKFLNEYGSEIVKSGEFKGQTMIDEHEWGMKKVGNTWQPVPGYENNPVPDVSWYGAYEYCRYHGWRLPTEAEWEYAARSGGKKERYAGTNLDNILSDYAWFSANSGSMTHPVGTREPNSLGLFDMSGNMWEWCQDWYASNYYSSSPNVNPQGPSSGTERVLRGGSWNSDIGLYFRSAYRLKWLPTSRFNFYGFRCARNL